uniref:Fatty acid desaturase domain-containing protein n=1 Tax=Tetradesmus obliquus TaxID=3088 RepID=A0A383V3J7_TETOB|eukprot:jgi/Sobl393_1/9558/SZX59661.1
MAQQLASSGALALLATAAALLAASAAWRWTKQRMAQHLARRESRGSRQNQLPRPNHQLLSSMAGNWERKVKAGAPSYSEQFRILKGCKDYDILSTPYAKPSPEAQAKEPGARAIPFSDVYAKSEDRPLLNLETTTMSKDTARIVNYVYCFMRFAIIAGMHVATFFVAPKYFSWGNLGMAMGVYCATGMLGITFCYHRMLTHRSFKCPKWLEYTCAFLGANSGQGEPIEWVSTHRYHHLHCDTPLDPHSPYEGFWWSHMGWLFKTEASLIDYANVQDLKDQFFYKFLEIAFLPWLLALRPYLTYTYCGGWAGLVWSYAVPMVITWHSTFLVNSAAHVYGRRPYETGDLSTNCWWVAAVSWGEGWHNSHHAFPQSARHGLEWWEIDLTWYLICGLKATGLAWDVHVPRRRMPSEKAKALKARQPALVKLTAKFE